MKNKKTKKLLKSLAVFAVSAGSVLTCFAAGCGHEHDLSWDKNDEGHWQICSGCDVKGELEPHKDDDNNHICDVCGQPLPDTSVVEPTTYYVGSHADSVTGDGTTAETAFSFAEFQRKVLVFDALNPGDTIKILPGEHMVPNGLIFNNNGAYNKYITIEASDPAQKTVLNFKQQLFHSTNRGVQIYGNFYKWLNIDICGAGDNGLYIGGSYNIVENCEFYNNRDTGLQLGRCYSEQTRVDEWPSYNLIKNCTSYNNYDNETYGENADGFAAKLTVGYGNIFDGCIAYRNSDDGWDLFGKPESGNIGRVVLYNCVAFENGYVMKTLKECNDWFGGSYNTDYDEDNTSAYVTRDGDGNGFKLGGSTMAGDVQLVNCMSFNNRMHGVTDNSNPGVLDIDGVTTFNNSAAVDTRSHLNIKDSNGNTNALYNSISSNGRILRSNGKPVIANKADHVPDGRYASIDKEGYILGSDSKFLTLNGQKIQGEFVMAATEGQEVNPNFGEIADTNTAEACHNFDIARTERSYNTFRNVLSVDGGNRYLGSDEYRGSAQYSYLCYNPSKDDPDDSSLAGLPSKSVKIESVMDASSYVQSLSGVQGDPLNAADIFAQLPANDMGMKEDVDATYRNADGSINMGDILKIKDYSVLFGDEHKIGCDLTKSSWDQYAHHPYVDLSSANISTNREAVVTAVEDLLYVPLNTSSCYQNFNVVVEMNDCDISWVSSDPSVLSVGTSVTETFSSGKSVEINVNRPRGGDKVVKLTATIKNSNVTRTKEFDINVKQYSALIGDIVIENATPDGYVILYQNEGEEPAFEISNASDYSGKLLAKTDYTVETEYFYGRDKNAQKNPTDRFRINRAGVYEIKQTVTIGSDSKDFEYIVYVVSKDGDIDFVGESIVNATYDGYKISGELSNVAGTLYTMVADSKPTAEQLKANGTAFEITKDTINASFKQDISEEFNVYYGIYNPNGDIKSEIYEKQIEIVEITTKDEFKDLASSGGDPSKIYKLINDLAFTTADGWAVGNAGFGGVLDGCGHTVSGISVANTEKGKASLFYRLEGGSVMNINFDNISLEGDNDVGIFGQSYGGYLHNIRMTDIRSTGVQRIGGLIGHAYENVGVPLIIDNVSLINTSSEAIIYGTTSRAGGIVGFIQSNSTASLKSLEIDIRISNIYVDALIGDTNAQQFGGVVGTYDTSTQANTPGFTYSMTINNCMFVGTIKANNRAGGIIGYQQGSGKLRVNNCVSFGDIYHAGSQDPITVAEKNASGIFGGYSGTADTLVENCFAKFGEHNSKYDVTVVDENRLKSLDFWNNISKFDFENTWELVTVKEGENDVIVAPYVRLKAVV